MKKMWQWGPVEGKPLYTSYFMVVIGNHLKKEYHYTWDDIYFYFENGKMTFLCDENKLIKNGMKLFNRWIMKDIDILKKRYNESLLNGKINDLKRFNELYLNFWTHGIVPEMANFGGEYILKRELKKYVDKENFNVVLEKLTKPEYPSFYRREEHELALAKDIKEHARKYHWILNSYDRVVKAPLSYFKKRKAKPLNKNFTKNIVAMKRRIFKKYNIPKDVQEICHKLSYSIWWQDHRKGEILKGLSVLDRFLSKIKWEKKENLLFYLPKELEEGKRINVEKRKKFFAFIYDGKLKYSTRKDYSRIPRFKKGELIRGTVVSSGGIIRGKVRIIKSINDKIREGEILIAAMTSPEYIKLMKKAKAIITDVGGLTSHAAVVSRELKKPCIVGTRVATKAFKNGDYILINFRNGTIKKIDGAARI